jgi:hypothetical protein
MVAVRLDHSHAAEMRTSSETWKSFETYTFGNTAR